MAKEALNEADYVRPIVLFQADAKHGEVPVEPLNAQLEETACAIQIDELDDVKFWVLQSGVSAGRVVLTIGEVWAAASKGRYLFAMVTDTEYAAGR